MFWIFKSGFLCVVKSWNSFVYQAGFEIRGLPASTSWSAGIKSKSLVALLFISNRGTHLRKEILEAGQVPEFGEQAMDFI